MASFFLQQGLVIKRLGQFFEYSARTEQELYFQEPETGKRLTLLEEQFWYEYHTARITVVDAFSSPKTLLLPDISATDQIRSLANLPEVYQLKADRILRYVSALKRAGVTRGQRALIETTVKNLAVHFEDPDGAPAASTIQRHWKNYETHQFDVFAVVSGNAFKRRKCPLDKDSEDFLQRMIDEKYATDKRPSIQGAYRDYVKALNTENNERFSKGQRLFTRVSERTFENRIKARPKEDIMIARFGREAARKHFKMIKGHLHSEHPLDVVEIDHTPMNLYCIDDMAYLPLGRPWMTSLKCRETGMLLGMYVTFQKTGLNSIFGCIKHSLCSHHRAYELWPEIENPWPSYGLGRTYLSDRGRDFQSLRYRTAIRELGSDYEHAEKHTPWVKASIERFFLTLEQTFFECLPGRTFANLQLRGDYKPEKDAVVRFSTLVYLLHKWAADYHNVIPHSRHLARPLDLWMEGIGNAPPPYPRSLDTLNVILGDSHHSKLSHEGLRYQVMCYANDQLNDLMRDLGKGINLNYVVSNENLGSIHVLDPRTNSYFLVGNTRPEYAEGLSLLQHIFIRKEASLRLKGEVSIDGLIETRGHIAERVQEEVLARDTRSKAHLARIAGINSNATLEGKNRSIQDPFQGQQLRSPAASDSTSTSVSFTNLPTYTWGL